MKGRRHDRRDAGLRAARPRDRAPPSARRSGPRGSAAACSRSLGLFAFYSAIGSFDDHRDVLVLDRRAGRRAADARDDRRPPVGPGRRRHGRRGHGPARPRRPRSRGAARSLIVVPLWVAHDHGQPARRQGRQPDGRSSPAASSTPSPISLGAFAGILSERSGMLNIAIEGKFLVGACCTAAVVGLRDPTTSSSGSSRHAAFAGVARGPAARLARASAGRSTRSSAAS